MTFTLTSKLIEGCLFLPLMQSKTRGLWALTINQSIKQQFKKKNFLLRLHPISMGPYLTKFDSTSNVKNLCMQDNGQKEKAIGHLALEHNAIPKKFFLYIIT